MNEGSYYEKMYASMLMTESVDNFISSSRSDFTDARYRATSIADLFPEGYRRWLAQNLTNDDELKGPRIASDVDGKPLIDADGYPANAIGVSAQRTASSGVSTTWAHCSQEVPDGIASGVGGFG